MSEIVKAADLAIKEKILCCIGVVWQIGFIPSPVIKFNHTQLKFVVIKNYLFLGFWRANNFDKGGGQVR
jgi:hypothetical protein